MKYKQLSYSYLKIDTHELKSCTDLIANLRTGHVLPIQRLFNKNHNNTYKFLGVKQAGIPIINIKQYEDCFVDFIEVILEKSHINTLNESVFNRLFALPMGFDANLSRASKQVHRNITKDTDNGDLCKLTKRQLDPLLTIKNNDIFDAANEVVRLNFDKIHTLYLSAPIPYAPFSSRSEHVFLVDYFTTMLTGRLDSLLGIHGLIRQSLDFSGHHKSDEYRIMGIHHKPLVPLVNLKGTITSTTSILSKQLNGKDRISIQASQAHSQEIYTVKHRLLLLDLNSEIKSMKEIEQPLISGKNMRVGIIPIFDDGRIGIHHVKSPKQNFQGFAQKVYEFSRGGVDSEEPLTVMSLQKAALRELCEELGIIGDSSTLRFLCDINEYIENKQSTPVRYFTVSVKQAAFIWDKGSKLKGKANETKGVIVTPFEKLSRLFSMNFLEYSGVGSSDMQVATYLEHFLQQQMSDSIVPTLSSINVNIPTLKKFEYSSHSEIDTLFTSFSTNKKEKLDELYTALKENNQYRKEYTLNNNVIYHFDTEYGRLNEAESIVGFVDQLRSSFEQDVTFSEPKFLLKIENWLSHKIQSNFTSKTGGLSTHFVRYPNAIEKLKFNFNRKVRVPLVCTSLFSSSRKVSSLSDYTFGFALNHPMPFLFTSFKDVDSAYFSDTFNHLTFKEAISTSKTQDDMTTIVSKHLFQEPKHGCSRYIHNREHFLSQRDFFDHFHNLDSTTYISDSWWTELMGFGHMGQLMGIILDPLKDLEIALAQHQRYLTEYKVSLPFLMLNIETNTLTSVSLNSMLEHILTQRVISIESALYKGVEGFSELSRSLHDLTVFYHENKTIIERHCIDVTPMHNLTRRINAATQSESFTGAVFLSSLDDVETATVKHDTYVSKFGIDIPFLVSSTQPDTLVLMNKNEYFNYAIDTFIQQIISQDFNEPGSSFLKTGLSLLKNVQKQPFGIFESLCNKYEKALGSKDNDKQQLELFGLYIVFSAALRLDEPSIKVGHRLCIKLNTNNITDETKNNVLLGLINSCLESFETLNSEEDVELLCHKHICKFLVSHFEILDFYNPNQEVFNRFIIDTYLNYTNRPFTETIDSSTSFSKAIVNEIKIINEDKISLKTDSKLLNLHTLLFQIDPELHEYRPYDFRSNLMSLILEKFKNKAFLDATGNHRIEKLINSMPSHYKAELIPILFSKAFIENINLGDLCERLDLLITNLVVLKRNSKYLNSPNIIEKRTFIHNFCKESEAILKKHLKENDININFSSSFINKLSKKIYLNSKKDHLKPNDPIKHHISFLNAELVDTVHDTVDCDWYCENLELLITTILEDSELHKKETIIPIKDYFKLLYIAISQRNHKEPEKQEYLLQNLLLTSPIINI